MNNKIVLIKSEEVGRGDDQLGKLLRANFLRMLAERPEVPRALFFLNDGVRLVCSDSPVLAQLAKLAERGCALLICQTCLEYLELVERVSVGEVSGMSEFLDLAERYEVITV